MSGYHRLLPDYRTLCVAIELREDPEAEINDELDMTRGLLLSAPPTSPLVFDFEVDEDEIMPGEAWKMPAYSTEGPTMDVALVAAIQGAGVNNLEVYPATLVNSRTGEVFPQWHVAVNVIGLVACADMDASRAQPLADTQFFHELKIDESRVGDLLMFRLAEQPSDIIVHGKVADTIRKGGFEGLILEDLA